MNNETASSAPSPTLWLVCNAASGSNDEKAVDTLLESLGAAGLSPARIVTFPEEPAPTPGELDEAGVDLLAVFAGDGTVHSVVTGVYGWGGAVLVLPGGTMNLLAKRLHGDVPVEQITARLSASLPDGLRRVRPKVIHGRLGEGLTGVLAGPGAVWNDVREALRSASVVDLVTSARDAIVQSANAPRVTCAEVDCGREEGYVAITVVPHEDGLVAKGFYAESLGDYAGQGLALLGRNFRNGPHDELGCHQRVRILSPTGDAMGLLMDGEPFDGAAEEVFELVEVSVDLVQTADVLQDDPEDEGSDGDAR